SLATVMLEDAPPSFSKDKVTPGIASDTVLLLRVKERPFTENWASDPACTSVPPPAKGSLPPPRELAIVTSLAVPVFLLWTTRLYCGVALVPTLTIDAVTAAPELLIASFRPASVLLVASMVIEVAVVPTLIDKVPVPMAAVVLV